MSTPASKRLRLSLSALAAMAVVYLVVTAGLQAIAGRAEASRAVYPYKMEDWLRYLLPTLWPTDGQPLMLLTGPSTVRENLLWEEFAAAFPEYRIFQGGISEGTLGDVMAGLDYVQRVHGVDALPRVIVLGLSPRFVAEMPREGRPFAGGLARYSPYYRVPGSDPVGFGLERKAALAGAWARTRFLVSKQQSRYATMTAWYVARLFSADLSERLRGLTVMDSRVIRQVIPGRALHIGIHDYALELASPYKYRNLKTNILAGRSLARRLDNPKSVWPKVFAWDPAKDAQEVRARIASLLTFAAQHQIEVYAVNLPEASSNRIRYREAYPSRYMSLLESAFDTIPLLNLRCLLDDDDFHDAEHARFGGAKRVSEEVIGFVRAARAARGTRASSTGFRMTATRLDAHRCLDPQSESGNAMQSVSVPASKGFNPRKDH